MFGGEAFATIPFAGSQAALTAVGSSYSACWSVAGAIAFTPPFTPSAFAAFAAPVHVAFGVTLDQNSKGHTAFGDQVI